jgi:predicted metal-dependent hydrolase
MFRFLRRSISRPQATDLNSDSTRTLEILNFRGRDVQVNRRAYRRTLGLTLQIDGRIRVSAPMGASLMRIEQFLTQHAAWIEERLIRYQSLREAHPPKAYVRGENFPLLGRRLKLDFVCSPDAVIGLGAGNRTGAGLRCFVSQDRLICEIPKASWQNFDPGQAYPEVIEPLRRFYREAGAKFISQRVELFSDRMQLKPAALSFRSQKTRWGSCSSKGKISLNWRLVVAPVEVIDYVVVHELSHLKHYNHSRAFWELVETQVPGHTRLRHWLREHQYEADFLALQSELHSS